MHQGETECPEDLNSSTETIMEVDQNMEYIQEVADSEYTPAVTSVAPKSTKHKKASKAKYQERFEEPETVVT